MLHLRKIQKPLEVAVFLVQRVRRCRMLSLQWARIQAPGESLHTDPLIYKREETARSFTQAPASKCVENF